jgi:hypothetical protein
MCVGCALRPPEQLEPHECDALHDILNDDERLAAGYELLQRLRRLIAHRSVRDSFSGWWTLQKVAFDPSPACRMAFRRITPRSSYGLKLPWSTGPVEGTVTRVKLLKRQGYGRASTRLLRRRVISAADPSMAGTTLNCRTAGLHRICGRVHSALSKAHP